MESPKERSGGGMRNQEKKNCENKFIGPKSPMKPSRKNTKKTTIRHIIKLIKTNYKEKIFKAARKKKTKQANYVQKNKDKVNRFLLGNNTDEKTEQQI